MLGFLTYSGDARLARSVKNKVFSLDLVSNDPSVIACDMSKVCAKLFPIFYLLLCLFVTRRERARKEKIVFYSCKYPVFWFQSGRLLTN